jgi:hypothetical protein
MRIAEYKKIGIKTEEYKIIVPAEYDEKGNITSIEHEETRTKEVPIMGLVYRDMTNDELNELEKEKAELPQEEATQQDRIEAQVIYTALMTDTLLEGESNV